MARLINQGKSLKIVRLMRTEANAADKEPHNGYIIQSSHFFQRYCYERYKKQEYLQPSYLKIPDSEESSQSYRKKTKKHFG